MASLFNRLASSARAAHGHFFAVLVTVRQTGTQDRIEDAILGRVRIETRREDNRSIRVAIRNCRFTKLIDVRHDAVVVESNGTQWSIDEIIDRQASQLTVTLRRTVAYQINRPTYRGKAA